MEPVAVNAGIMAFMVFSGAIIVLGLFLAGVHVMPEPEKAVATVSVVCKVAGIGELIGAVLLLTFSPLGEPVSLFLGTLIGFFGLLFLITAWVLEKGGDLRPFGTYLLFVAVALIIYGSFAGMVPGMGELAALLFLVAVACILSCVGTWGWSPAMGKLGGWLLVIVGIWGIRFWAMDLFAGSIKVMLGG